MLQGKASKSTCPGNPTTNAGFSSHLKWFICGSEVFQIYAKGKRVGDKITDQDDIAFYAPFEVQTVQFKLEQHTISNCMVQAGSYQRPFNAAAFDKCPEDSVEITIYD